MRSVKVRVRRASTGWVAEAGALPVAPSRPSPTVSGALRDLAGRIDAATKGPCRYLKPGETSCNQPNVHCSAPGCFTVIDIFGPDP